MQELCIMCNKSLAISDIVTVNKKGVETIRKYSIQRNDGLNIKLDGLKTLHVHVSCRKSYVNENIIKPYLKQKELTQDQVFDYNLKPSCNQDAGQSTDNEAIEPLTTSEDPLVSETERPSPSSAKKACLNPAAFISDFPKGIEPLTTAKNPLVSETERLSPPAKKACRDPAAFISGSFKAIEQSTTAGDPLISETEEQPSSPAKRTCLNPAAFISDFSKGIEPLRTAKDSLVSETERLSPPAKGACHHTAAFISDSLKVIEQSTTSEDPLVFKTEPPSPPAKRTCHDHDIAAFVSDSLKAIESSTTAEDTLVSKTELLGSPAKRPCRDPAALISSSLISMEDQVTNALPQKDFYNDFGLYIASLLRELSEERAKALLPKIMEIVTAASNWFVNRNY